MHLIRAPGLRAFANAPPLSLPKLAIPATITSLPASPTSRTPSRRSQHSSSTTQRRHKLTAVPSIRHASTSTSPNTAASSPTTTTTSTSPASPQNQNPTLNWNDFLRLRRIRRFYNLGGSVLTSIAGAAAGASIFASYDVMGYGQSITGLDPFIIMGLFGVVSAGSGWLVGPVVGSSVWGLVYRRFGVQMRAKEKDFFERIKKYRVDPTSSSMQNPVPDYYGEKITSVAGYRRWLKDQRAFNRKRSAFV